MKFDLYTRLYLWLVAHRKWVFLGLALVTGLGVWLSSRIELREDILEMLPQHDRRGCRTRYRAAG